MERGNTNVTIDQLRKLAQILDKDLSFFLQQTSFQLRHAPGLQGSQQETKDKFVSYVRSLKQANKEQDHDV